MTSTMEWIRRTYDVPARHGMRITYDGKPATIVGTRGPYLAFRVDGEKRIAADHPTYRIVYPAVPEPVRPRGWCKHCMQDRAMTADGVMGRHHWSGRSYSAYSSKSQRWSKPCPGTGQSPWKPVRNLTHPGEQRPPGERVRAPPRRRHPHPPGARTETRRRTVDPRRTSPALGRTRRSHPRLALGRRHQPQRQTPTPPAHTPSPRRLTPAKDQHRARKPTQPNTTPTATPGQPGQNRTGRPVTQPEPPTEQQLDNITAKVAELRERLDRKNPWPSDNESYFVAEGWKNGTRNALDKLNPAGLVAEIRRLQDALTKEEQLHTSTIGDRDHFHDMADRLAYAVAPEEVIGEHSSMNDPWENALDLITPIAEVDRLRAALAAAVALHEKGEHNGLAICLHCAQQMYPPPETGIWSESAYPCATLQALGVGLTSGDTDDDL